MYMADTQNLTQFEQFYSLINSPSELVGKEVYTRLEPTRERLRKILFEGDPSIMSRQVHQLARQLQETQLLPTHLNPDEIQASFDPRAFLPQNLPEVPVQTQQYNFELPQWKSPSGGERATKPKPSKLTDVLHSVQEEALINQFDELQKEQNPEKRAELIQRFFDEQLDAEALIKGQRTIILEHLKTIALSDEQKESIEKAFAEREEKTAQKTRGKEDIQKKKEKKEEFVQQLLKEKDPLKLKQNVRKFIQDSQMNIFIDEYEDFGELLNLEAFAAVQESLFQSMQNQMALQFAEQQEIERLTIAQTESEVALAEEEPQTAPNTPTFQNNQPQNGQRLTNGRKNLRGGNLLKKEAEKAEEKTLEKGGKKLVKKILLKDPKLWIILGVVLLFFLLAGAIIVAISGLLGKTKDNSTSQSETKIPGLTFIVNAPEKVNNGDSITYRIHVEYTGSEAITIKDPLPTHVQNPTNTTGSYTISNDTIFWTLSANTPSPTETPSVIPSPTIAISPPPQQYNFSFTVSTKYSDDYVYNTIFATAADKQQFSTLTTIVGNPPPEDIQVVQFVKDIQTACPRGLVSPSTYRCIDNIPNLTQQVRDQLKYNGNFGNFLQCGIFIEAVLMYKNTLKPTPLLWPNANWAIDWFFYYISHTNEAYQAIPNTPQNHMQPGDIPIWRSDTYGHVGYVTQVLDDNTFQVAEANYVAGVVDLRYYLRNYVSQPYYIDNAYLPLLGWLRKR